MTRPPFVDAHVHLWDLDHLRYPWLSPPFDEGGPNGSTEPIAHDYLLDDYLADAEPWNIHGFVHIDAGAAPEHAFDETAWLENLAASRGMPNGIVGFAPLDDPDVERWLDAHAAHPHVRGIRHIVNWHADPDRTYSPRDLTQTGEWARGYGLLGRYGLSFDLQCYPDQMPRLAPLIAENPGVPVIINHLGMPVLSDPDGVARWRHGLLSLSALDHVSVKLSGFGFIDRNWTPERVRPFVLEAIALFGTSRCMFGSDAPTDKLFASFNASLDACHSMVADFSDYERRDLFGRNANRVYRLGLDL